MAEEAILLVRRKTPVPPPPLPHDAGEHDDFMRGIAVATPRPWHLRHPWIGLISFVVLVVAIVATCVHIREKLAPLPEEHVLPVQHGGR